MAHKSPHAKRIPGDVIHVEGETYKLPYGDLFPFNISDISGLPSLNLSLYYMQSVKFRTGPLFWLFDEQSFTISLRQFYKAPMKQAQAKPLWFIHYLVIMSLGKALVTDRHVGGAHDATAPGSKLLSRALRLLPDMSFLCSEPIEATEILCSIALHLQSIDHRCAAHLYVSGL
jgi:proline utilization trans-activator